MIVRPAIAALILLQNSNCQSTDICEEDPSACDVDFGGNYADEAGVRDMIEKEFDPTSEEGSLFQLSSMESLDMLSRKEYFESREGDTKSVEAAFTECYNLWKDTADDYSGMREFKGAIIGAGDLRGIPLNLFKNYEEVALADVSLQLTQESLSNSPDPSVTRSMSFFQEDVTGMIGGFRWKTEYLFGIVDSQSKAYKAIADYIESPKFYPEHQQFDTPFNSSLRYASTSDVIVVNLLLHQLGPVYINHLTSEIQRLKGERWNNVGGKLVEGLGLSTVTLHKKLTNRFVSEMVRKMGFNPNRKMLVIISLEKQVEIQENLNGEVLRSSVLRNGNVDTDAINKFKENGTMLYDSTATMVSRRWEENGFHHKLEETVRITGITYGTEMTFKDYLDSINDGRNSEMYTN
eukprot:TRINITY_DN6627_c0_g1_i1.p1 TRINITY_DN6627_c0_g1~~TRINITY_DN6627_c0_g1_i1.p1  ORF type:complete len:406 (+),score=83.22 TRINITY_DN6627_c0_g1_i1:57-1274(+)